VIRLSLGLLLVASLRAQLPVPPTITLSSRAGPGSCIVTVGLATTTAPNDTLVFTCSSLWPQLSCPPQIVIPRSYPVNAPSVLGVRMSYLGVPILAMPGLVANAGPLACSSCSWSNNLNPNPGDWMVAQVSIDAVHGQFVDLQPLWTGYPALPVVSLVCSTSCGSIVISQSPFQITIQAP